MKKVVLLITILFVSVISTACINNLAVQELNNKAKEYMANGETEKAICRLRSSIDLDTSIFETHYNLGVALIDTKEYADAQASLENAVKLKPDFPDSYYSLAVSFENQAYDIINHEDKTDKSDKADKASSLLHEETPVEQVVEQKQEQAKELSEGEKNQIVEKFNAAIDNYNKYLSKKPSAEDKDKVASQIDYLTNQIKKYNSDRNTNMSETMSGSNGSDD